MQKISIIFVDKAVQSVCGPASLGKASCLKSKPDPSTISP